MGVIQFVFGVQQSPEEEATLSARLGISPLDEGSSISPKSLASESQTEAMRISLIDSPLGLCVVHLTNVVLKAYVRTNGQHYR